MMKSIDAWQMTVSALVVAAACATGCVASDDRTDPQVGEPAHIDEPGIKVDPSGAAGDPAAENDATRWSPSDPPATSSARQNGDCCDVLCSNGGTIVNLWLTSGCDAWAATACQHAYVPAAHLIDAWWGSCR